MPSRTAPVNRGSLTAEATVVTTVARALSSFRSACVGEEGVHNEIGAWRAHPSNQECMKCTCYHCQYVRTHLLRFAFSRWLRCMRYSGVLRSNNNQRRIRTRLILGDSRAHSAEPITSKRCSSK
eukprot:scaffold133085_cov29-Tisochrysis_lutea.AAC.2